MAFESNWFKTGEHCDTDRCTDSESLLSLTNRDNGHNICNASLDINVSPNRCLKFYPILASISTEIHMKSENSNWIYWGFRRSRVWKKQCVALSAWLALTRIAIDCHIPYSTINCIRNKYKYKKCLIEFSLKYVWNLQSVVFICVSPMRSIFGLIWGSILRTTIGIGVCVESDSFRECVHRLWSLPEHCSTARLAVKSAFTSMAYYIQCSMLSISLYSHKYELKGSECSSVQQIIIYSESARAWNSVTNGSKYLLVKNKSAGIPV